MSRGAVYLGLLANLRHDQMIYEARQRSNEVIRPRRRRGISDTVLRALRIKR